MTIPQPPADQPSAYAYPPAAPPRKTNGLGITSIILGGLAFLGAFIPFLNYGTGFIAFVGLVLGIIGLILKNHGKPTAIAGTIISVVALILSIVMAIVYTAAFTSGVSNAIATASAEANQDVAVVYQASGDGKASIFYSTFSNGRSGTESATGTILPWEKDLTVKAGGQFDFNSFNLTVTGDADTTSVTCTISVAGKVISTQTGNGAYSTASCNASGSDLTK
ncbi:hypothetical protein BH09ACT6_BH09ACT6_18310 [soil metagenome]